MFQALSECDDYLGDSPDTSLYEHGIARNSDTGVSFLYNFDSGEVIERIITLDDVFYVLDILELSSFDEELGCLHEEHLSSVIKCINENSDFFLKV